jgi:capsular polysaccharide biosynthesis protein
MFYSLLFAIFRLIIVLSVLLRFVTVAIFKLFLVSSCYSIFSFMCNVKSHKSKKDRQYNDQTKNGKQQAIKHYIEN